MQTCVLQASRSFFQQQSVTRESRKLFSSFRFNLITAFLLIINECGFFLSFCGHQTFTGCNLIIVLFHICHIKLTLYSKSFFINQSFMVFYQNLAHNTNKCITRKIVTRQLGWVRTRGVWDVLIV